MHDLTQRRHWWLDAHRAACQDWGAESDSAVLTNITSYEKVRADLKELAGSAWGTR